MIHSRILIKNIYYMLAYAFSVLKQSSIEKVSGEHFENIHNLFAAILARGIGQQLKHGLHREYVLNEAQMSVIRGKINLHSTLKERLNCTNKVACEFDELSENNLFNQILKTTVLLLLKNEDVEQKYKDDLKQKMLFFVHVDTLEPRAINWSRLRFHRNNHTYRVLISLCQFILEGMLLSQDHGEQKLSSFVDDQRLCRLYEKFILEYYRRHHPQLKANASQIPWAVDDTCRTLLPVMQSDITLSYGKKTLIIDAKCYGNTLQKRYEKQTIHAANLYQIFTYVKNKMLQPGFTDHEIQGLLLYAKTVEAIQPDATFQMSGNQISVKTLDLNCPFEEIKRQLDDIAARMYC
jgi:5-methylcytosine-specific restriction enzyme subunit McrC